MLPSPTWPSEGVAGFTHSYCSCKAVVLSVGLSLEGDGDTLCQWVSQADGEKISRFALGN